ncbi:MAG: DUF6531 domain-containing protein, partial [Ekhidna sp.]
MFFEDCSRRAITIIISFFLLILPNLASALNDIAVCPANHTPRDPVEGEPQDALICVPNDNPNGAFFTRIGGGMVSGGNISSGGSGGASASSDGFSDNSENTGAPECGAGNPIDIATQSKVQVETDFIGYGQLPLSVSRTYNSAGGGVGIFGKKWSSNLVKKVTWRTYTTNAGTPINPTPSSQIAEVKFLHADGKVITYEYDEAYGVWRHLSGKIASLAIGDDDKWYHK